MSLSITPVSASVNQNTTQTFVASGGTAPYTFSMVSGGGTIDPSSGVYTAPPQTGVAIVRVTDSAIVPATAQATITINSALTLFCDIIRQEMGLGTDQVYLWDQKINIPSDSRLYIIVGVLTCKPFGNQRRYDGSGSGLNENQSVNMQATLNVDIFSKSVDARDRKEEVIMALKSDYSQYQQEANGFFISQLPSAFTNLSQLEGSAIPYRWNFSVAIQYKMLKSKAVDYYDNFQVDSVLTDA